MKGGRRESGGRREERGGRREGGRRERGRGEGGDYAIKTLITGIEISPSFAMNTPSEASSHKKHGFAVHNKQVFAIDIKLHLSSECTS